MALAGYNPAAYVPGGSSTAVSKAIQTAGRIKIAAPSPYANPTTSSTTPPATPPLPQAPTAQDYQNYLATDPIFGQATANINSAGLQNMAGLQAAQARALAQYGTVPSGNLPGVTGIDQATRDLAQQNTQAGTSTTARLANAYQQADQASNASLAARGLLRSGASGQHAAENLLNYNTAGYDANQKLLDYLSGLYSGYQQQQQALQAQATSASGDAYQRLIQQILAGINPVGAAPPPDNTPPPSSYSGASSGSGAPAGYTDIGGAAFPAGTAGQQQSGGIVVNNSGGYYDPMTSRYYAAGTGPAKVKPLTNYAYANAFA